METAKSSFSLQKIYTRSLLGLSLTGLAAIN
jgi:hypothetical protein